MVSSDALQSRLALLDASPSPTRPGRYIDPDPTPNLGAPDPREVVEDLVRDHGRPRLVRGSDFVECISLPEPVIDGLHQRGRVNALTAPTNHGKTAVAALMQISVAMGIPFAGRTVERGRVLVLAGENPDDFGLRLRATAHSMQLDPRTALHDVLVVPGAFALGLSAIEYIADQLRKYGPVVLVVVDTSVAYYGGEDENAAVPMRTHGANLRRLTGLPGTPAVMPLCHPVKNPDRDNLVPRGGGSFLSEIDGNLTLWQEGAVTTMHWAQKLRSQPFDPIRFELSPEELPLTDSKGRPVSSVAATWIDVGQAELLRADSLSRENNVLLAMRRTPGASVSAIAQACGFKGKGTVSNALQRLGRARPSLVKQSRNGSWTLTSEGERAADEVAEK